MKNRMNMQQSSPFEGISGAEQSRRGHFLSAWDPEIPCWLPFPSHSCLPSFVARPRPLWGQGGDPWSRSTAGHSCLGAYFSSKSSPFPTSFPPPKNSPVFRRNSPLPDVLWIEAGSLEEILASSWLQLQQAWQSACSDRLQDPSPGFLIQEVAGGPWTCISNQLASYTHGAVAWTALLWALSLPLPPGASRAPGPPCFSGTGFASFFYVAFELLGWS